MILIVIIINIIIYKAILFFLYIMDIHGEQFLRISTRSISKFSQRLLLWRNCENVTSGRG